MQQTKGKEDTKEDYVSIVILKKDGTTENFNPNKIKEAVKKSSRRTSYKLSEQQLDSICQAVLEKTKGLEEPIKVEQIHNIVEAVLEDYNKEIAASYRNYRNYKKDFVAMLDKVYQENQRIMYLGDKENSNIDSALVSTKRTLVYNELSKELYKKFFLSVDELQAIKDGYIYIHDMSARLNTINCCLFDVSAVLKDGFEMGNIWYNEPKSLDVAFDVIGDIVMSASAQQYGGFTLPEVDKVLEPYAQKSFKNYYNNYISLGVEDSLAIKQSLKDVEKDFLQGFQGWEYKFNTVASSRGDYPFITVTSGLSTSDIGKLCNKCMLKVRMNGQGKKGNKKPVLFPKIVFLYDKELHGEGKPLHDIYLAGIECSKKTMYPDWLSLTGEGYVSSMYKKYTRIVSPMGCRAFLSPWYERGGMKPADENDKPIFVGRFNIGAVSLHLPMILAKARQENKDFYEVLDHYLEMIRNLHKRTYEYLGEMKASTNPLAYCEGGFYGGHLKYNEKIKPVLKSATASFGITALNELQQLYNKKSLVEDGQFALDVMKYINEKVSQFKEEDGLLYALYGTPAENTCICGDEEVQTYEGNKAIKEIKQGDLVYSFNEDRKTIELKKVVASRKTKANAVVVKVSFDNQQSIICTPEHPFYVRKMKFGDNGYFKGEYLECIQAKDLKNGDRIKSNYWRLTDKGRIIFSGSNDGTHRYRINAEYKYGIIPKGYEIHHINENKLDDSFENLELLTTKQHRLKHVEKQLGKFKFKKGEHKGILNNFYGKKHTEETKRKNHEFHIGESIERFDLDMKHIQHFECRMDAERLGFTGHALSQCCKGTYKYGGPSMRKYRDSYWYYTKDCKDLLESNHKVVSVEWLDNLHDVYNIEVEDNHNFFIGGERGLLVHNCGLQVKQFREKYGIIENVSDRAYVSNSFHCHVTEDITPIQKQDLEGRFWDTMNGGKIQYVKYPISYNTEAVKTLVERAMDKGFYEGVNLSLSYCDDCGHEELNMDVCPKCGSRNLTKIDRMNGYLSYSRVKGDSRLADHKMVEIHDRKSM